jgi:hypothetical protein
MNWAKIIGFILCILAAAQSVFVFAFETDQFNLPDAPLADIGDEVDDYVFENITKAIGEINAQILASQNCFEKISSKENCDSPEKEKAKLEALRSEETVAREVFKLLGDGIPPLTNSGTWMQSHQFKAQPARFKTPFGKSIYRTAPVNYLTISDTVNFYSVELGTDKIAHIFQQGYTYYRIVERAKAKNIAPSEAVRKAINWGRTSEKTYYGFWVSGVFSNGDLAANFAGMKFYEHLTREVKLDFATLAPLLVLKNGFWKFNENFDTPRESILKPFISNHLNEALNPSVYMEPFGFRSVVRKTVKKQACAGWLKTYPNLKQADYAAITENLKLWHGEDYGFKDSRDFITIANTCFDK